MHIPSLSRPFRRAGALLVSDTLALGGVAAFPAIAHASGSTQLLVDSFTGSAVSQAGPSVTFDQYQYSGSNPRPCRAPAPCSWTASPRVWCCCCSWASLSWPSGAASTKPREHSRG